MYTQPTYTQSDDQHYRTNPSLATAAALAVLPVAVLLAAQFPAVALGALAGAAAVRAPAALRHLLRTSSRTRPTARDRRPA